MPLSELVLHAEEYDGREIVAQGLVREFGDDSGPVPRHFVIHDAEDNRVRLLPDAVAQPHVGKGVEVVGEFDFDPDQGRLLYVETLEPIVP